MGSEQLSVLDSFLFLTAHTQSILKPYWFLLSNPPDIQTLLPNSSAITLIVLPDVRIPERDERRLSRQCSSQKGKFITDSSQGFLPQPTQWCMVSKSLKQRLLAKFISYAYAVSSWLKLIGYMFAKQFYWYKLRGLFSSPFVSHWEHIDWLAPGYLMGVGNLTSSGEAKT